MISLLRSAVVATPWPVAHFGHSADGLRCTSGQLHHVSRRERLLSRATISEATAEVKAVDHPGR